MSIAIAGSAMQTAMRRRRAEDFAREQAQADQAYRQQQAERQASQFDASHGLRLREVDAANEARQFDQGSRLAEQIPGETFLAGDSPEAQRIPSALLQETPEIKPMGESFQGPMQGGATPQDAQRGRKGGFLKTRTQAQQAQADTLAATSSDREADNARADAQIAEAARHNRASEGLQRAGIDARTKTGAAGDGLAEMVRNNPDLLKELPPTERARVLRELARTGGALPNRRNEAVETMVTQALDSASRLVKHPGFSGAFGAKGPSSLFGVLETPMGGTDAAGATRVYEALRSQLTLPNLQYLRGLGHMSDREFKAITDSVTALDRGMPEVEAKTEIGRIITTLQAAQQRLTGGGGNPPPGDNSGRVYYDADGNPVQR